MRDALGETLRLVQISDCHVSSDPDATYRGRDADSGLKSLLPAVSAFGPDALLLSGDISEDASPESYRCVARRVESLGVPVLALPGNHDDPGVMRSFFPEGPWAGPLFRHQGHWLLVLLDSTERERIDGVIGVRQMKALRQGLASSPAGHVLVALHHQPVNVGSPWIDKYSLEAGERLMDLLRSDGRVRCVAWGHVHHDFRARREGITLLGAPSTVANSRTGQEKFALDDLGPACRWLELAPDGTVDTGLLSARSETQ